MKKEECDNPIRRQIIDLFSLIDFVVAECFSEKLFDVLSIPEIFDVRKILITGCGDCLSAALAVEDLFGETSGTFGCEAVEAVEFSRFYTASKIGIGEPNSPLVIALSSSGNTARIVEILEKCKELGSLPLLITNRTQSPCVDVAEHRFVIELPEFKGNVPGLRTYFSNIIALIALSVRIGHVRNILRPDTADKVKKAIKEYVESYRKGFEKMDEQIYELAVKYKDIHRANIVYGVNEKATALFSAQKFYETCGIPVQNTDSEEWCHIDYFMKDPETIGTIFFVNQDSKDLDRIRKTIQAAQDINRPSIVITDLNEEFGNADVIRTPSVPKGYAYLRPLLNYVPSALLAAYLACLNHHLYFNELDPFSGEQTGDGMFFDKNKMNLSTSKIQIVR